MTDPVGQNEPDRDRPDGAGPDQDRPGQGRPAAPGGPAPAAEPVYADRVFRSGSGILGGVVLLAVAAWLGVDAILHGAGRVPWFAAAALLLVVPVVTAYTLRPAVQASDRRMRIRNPLRTVEVPWAAVERISAAFSVEVVAGGRTYQLWAIPVSLRQRKKAGLRTARTAAGDAFGSVRTAAAPAQAQADRSVGVLREYAERNAARPEAAGEVTSAWCWWVVAPAAAGLLAILVLAATG